MEPILMKARSSHIPLSQACVDYINDGGIRNKAWSSADRIPYVGADLKVHPLCVAPVVRLD